MIIAITIIIIISASFSYCLLSFVYLFIPDHSILSFPSSLLLLLLSLSYLSSFVYLSAFFTPSGSPLSFRFLCLFVSFFVFVLIFLPNVSFLLPSVLQLICYSYSNHIFKLFFIYHILQNVAVTGNTRSMRTHLPTHPVHIPLLTIHLT